MNLPTIEFTATFIPTAGIKLSCKYPSAIQPAAIAFVPYLPTNTVIKMAQHIISFPHWMAPGQPILKINRITFVSGRQGPLVLNRLLNEGLRKTSNGIIISINIPITVAIAAPFNPSAGVPWMPGINPGIPSSPKIRM